jgi:uncharacterized delta-60 repeat protein
MRRFLLTTLLLLSTSVIISTDPYLTQVLGDAGAAPTTVSRSSATAGTSGEADTTFATNGAVDFNAAYSYATSEGPGKAILKLSNGDMFIASNHASTHTLVIKLDSDGNKITAFGTSGILTISSVVDVKHMLLAQDGDLLVAGGNGSSGSKDGWVKKFNVTNGTEDTNFDITVADSDHDQLDVVGMIGQQTTGRIIVCGKKDGNGAIIAYNSVTGKVDRSFSTNGLYDSGSARAVWQIAVDTNNQIYFTYDNASNVHSVKRLHQNGLIDSWVSATTISSVGRNEDTHLILDQNGQPVVVTADDSDNIILKRWDKSSAAELATKTLSTGDTGLGADTLVQAFMVDTAGKLIVMGYQNTTTDVPFVLRVEADITSGLDTSFNTTGVQTTSAGMTGNDRYWYDGIIADDGRLYVVGGTNVPFLLRLYGDQYVGQVDASIAAGAAGTLDTTFDVGNALDTDAALDLGGVDASLDDTAPIAVAALSTGDHVITLNDTGNSVCKLVRLASDNSLQTTFHATSSVPGIAADGPVGVQAMLITDDSKIILTGNDGSNGWLKRYDLSTGIVDNSWSVDGVVTFGSSTVTPKAIREQSGGRIIVSGHDSGNNGVIYGFNPNTGAVDTLFATNGVYSTGVDAQVETIAIDSKNRIVFAYKDGSNNVQVGRLLPYGTLDDDFGTNGFVATNIASASDSMHLCINTNDNITIAAVKSGAVAMRQYTSTGAVEMGFNGGNEYSAYINITTITNCVSVEDNKILVSGHRGGDNLLFVSRVNANGSKDTTFKSGAADGILNFKVTTASRTARVNNDIAIAANGTISIVGYEDNAGTKEPFIAKAYAAPYKTAVAQDQSLQTVGSVDGDVDGISAGDEGILFYLGAGGASLQQKARAVNLYNNKYVVAVDGQDDGDAQSNLFISQFDLDGNLDTTWDTNTGTDGWSKLTRTYNNEYVRDMITFSQGGNDKALLAGHITSGSPLNVTQSLLMQYNLSTDAVDTTFGGIDGDASGTAFGDAKQFFKVGRQSNGRIIAAGIDQSDNGVLVGYTKTGAIDKIFGLDGCRVQETNAEGIYNFVVDAQDRVIVVYDDGSNNAEVACVLPDGSGLDSTFGTSGKVASANRITNVGLSSNMTIALDQDQKLVVAAVTDSNPGTSDDDQVTLRRYDAAGATDGNALVLTNANLGTPTALSMVKVIVDADNAIYVLLRDDDASDDNLLIAKVKADLSGLDTSFGTNGYLAYQVRDASTTRYMTDAILQADGRITAVGYEV